MGFFNKIADKFGKDETTEVRNLETGEQIKITRTKEPASLKKPEGLNVERRDIPDSDGPKDVKVKSVRDASKKVDLVTLLEEDIRKAMSIKEERDALLQEVLTLREQVKEMHAHKSAKESAESRAGDLEATLKKLRDEKSELEESVGRLKEERESVESKLRKFETVLLRIKDKVVDMDKNLI